MRRRGGGEREKEREREGEAEREMEREREGEGPVKCQRSYHTTFMFTLEVAYSVLMCVQHLYFK